MAQDWNAAWTAALAAAKDAVGKDIPEVENYLKQVAAGHEKALQSLAQARMQGVIDQPTFECELDDEADVFKAELLAMQALGKALVQKAANAFFNALLKAVQSGISGLI